MQERSQDAAVFKREKPVRADEQMAAEDPPRAAGRSGIEAAYTQKRPQDAAVFKRGKPVKADERLDSDTPDLALPDDLEQRKPI